MFRIVTDTSANLPTAYLQQEHITIIPFTFHADGDEQACLDLNTFDAKTFYAQMRSGTKVSTSQIPPQRYLDVLTPMLEAGEDVLACRDPLRPAEITHLLIPARGLAFVTTGEGVRYEGKPYRRLRVDAMAEEKLTRAEKAHLRFIRRVRRALEEEAVASLKRAKRGHDALEALYRPCVDFDAVGALCDAEIARIGAYPV